MYEGVIILLEEKRRSCVSMWSYLKQDLIGETILEETTTTQNKFHNQGFALSVNAYNN